MAATTGSAPQLAPQYTDAIQNNLDMQHRVDTTNAAAQAVADAAQKAQDDQQAAQDKADQDAQAKEDKTNKELDWAQVGVDGLGALAMVFGGPAGIAAGATAEFGTEAAKTGIEEHEQTEDRERQKSEGMASNGHPANAPQNIDPDKVAAASGHPFTSFKPGSMKSDEEEQLGGSIGEREKGLSQGGAVNHGDPYGGDSYARFNRLVGEPLAQQATEGVVSQAGRSDPFQGMRSLGTEYSTNVKAPVEGKAVKAPVEGKAPTSIPGGGSQEMSVFGGGGKVNLDAPPRLEVPKGETAKKSKRSEAVAEGKLGSGAMDNASKDDIDALMGEETDRERAANPYFGKGSSKPKNVDRDQVSFGGDTVASVIPREMDAPSEFQRGISDRMGTQGRGFQDTFASGSSEKAQTNTGRSMAGEMADKFRNEVGGRVGASFEGAKKQASAFGDAAKQQAGKFGEAAKDQAGKFGEAAKDRAGKFGEAAKEGARSFGEGLKKKGKGMKESWNKMDTFEKMMFLQDLGTTGMDITRAVMDGDSGGGGGGDQEVNVTPVTNVYNTGGGGGPSWTPTFGGDFTGMSY